MLVRVYIPQFGDEGKTIAMATHGSIGEFDPDREDWTSYTERLEQYFTANDVKDAGKQRAILLSVCGPTSYQLIRNLVAPNKPTEKTFAEICSAVKDHHHPKPSAIVRRFQFHSRTRRDGESISAYVAELRKLSEHCDFEATLETMLRDRLVCGINDSRLQRRLLAEKDLTFQTAMDIAQAMEAADRSAKDLAKLPPSTAPVNFVRKQREGNCYRCGGKHTATTCSFKDADCHNCGKKGHITRACRSKLPKKQPQGSRKRGGAHYNKKPNSNTMFVNESEDTHCDSTSHDTAYTLFSTKGGPATRPITAHLLWRRTKGAGITTGGSELCQTEGKLTSLGSYRPWPKPAGS